MSFTSSLRLLLLLFCHRLTSDLRVMIPRREDDDCTACAVWSVFTEPLCLRTSNPSISAPSVYLHLYRHTSASVL